MPNCYEFDETTGVCVCVCVHECAQTPQFLLILLCSASLFGGRCQFEGVLNANKCLCAYEFRLIFFPPLFLAHRIAIRWRLYKYFY